MSPTFGATARALGIPGSGFGLYLSEAIVKHHGGRIDVQSALGEGSVFTMRLPNAVAAPATGTREAVRA